MSIPKKIHYCWFGGGKLPGLAEKCIRSWKKYCPDYELICWNETNFDLSANRYVKEAYDAKKWAFISDYVRLKVIHEYGGVYLDTDVELLKPLDGLLVEGAYMGLDESGKVCTGLGFAAEAGDPVVYELLKDYDDIPFKKDDGTFDMMPCPDRNTSRLISLGMKQGTETQVFMGVRFLNKEYLCPMEYYSGKKSITEKTYSIHHYSASWTSKTSRRTIFLKRLIGVRLYDKLYGKFLHKIKGLEW